MSERIRVEWGPFLEETKVFVNGNYWFTESGNTFRNWRWQKDIVGNPGGFNPCSHVVLANLSPFRQGAFTYTEQEWWEEGPPPSTVLTFKGDDSWRGAEEPFLTHDNGWDPPRLPPEIVYIPVDEVGPFVKNAVENALTQVPLETLIVNFLMELPNPRNWKNLLPRMDRWSIDSPAEILLWWEFGTKPLVQDIKKLVVIFDTIRKRLEHLKRVNNRTVTIRSHDRNIVNWFATEVPDFGPVYGDISEIWQSRANMILRHRCDINMNFHVKYALEGLDEPLAFVQALAASLGLTNPIGVIWEGIPFSFVVDWFVSIADWIENNLSFEPFKGDIQVVGVDHTIKAESILGRCYPTTNAGDWRLGGTERVRAYYRRIGCPPNNCVFTGLSPKQYALAAALLQTGVSRKRRRRRLKAVDL